MSAPLPHEHDRCGDFLGQISDLVDGNTSAEICQEILAHLEECDNCRIVVNTLKKTITLYQMIGQENNTLPAAVRERLYKTLHLDNYGQ